MTTVKELSTEIKYISKSIDEMKSILEKGYEEQRKTNGRVTTLEVKMEGMDKLPDKVEEHTKDIARFKVFGPVVTAFIATIISAAAKMFFEGKQ